MSQVQMGSFHIESQGAHDGEVTVTVTITGMVCRESMVLVNSEFATDVFPSKSWLLFRFQHYIKSVGIGTIRHVCASLEKAQTHKDTNMSAKLRLVHKLKPGKLKFGMGNQETFKNTIT